MKGKDTSYTVAAIDFEIIYCEKGGKYMAILFLHVMSRTFLRSSFNRKYKWKGTEDKQNQVRMWLNTRNKRMEEGEEEELLCKLAFSFCRKKGEKSEHFSFRAWLALA